MASVKRNNACQIVRFHHPSDYFRNHLTLMFKLVYSRCSCFHGNRKLIRISTRIFALTKGVHLNFWESLSWCGDASLPASFLPSDGLLVLFAALLLWGCLCPADMEVWNTWLCVLLWLESQNAQSSWRHFHRRTHILVSKDRKLIYQWTV